MMCFDESGYSNGVNQKDWAKLAKIVLEIEKSIPLKQMLLKSKQEAQIF